LFFVLAALSVAGIAFGELAIMHSRAIEEIARAQRWTYLPVFFLIVAIVGFVHFYLGTGRLWLGIAACLTRFVALIINFAWPPSLNFREITGLRLFDFVGDTVAMPEGVISPWTRVGEVSSLLLLAFVVDASITLWRRGTSESRRRAVVLGGSIVLFIILAAGFSSLIHARVLHAPYLISLPFLGVVLAMGFELSNDILRAAQTAGQLRVSEMALRESEVRMNLATEAADLVPWTWDILRDEVWITERGREVFGLATAEPLSFTRFLEALHIDDRSRIEKLLGFARAEGGDYEGEYRVVSHRGRYRAGHDLDVWHGQGRRFLQQGLAGIHRPDGGSGNRRGMAERGSRRRPGPLSRRL
jgi:two-component system, LuxR family, sensor kinase FixL